MTTYRLNSKLKSFIVHWVGITFISLLLVLSFIIPALGANRYSYLLILFALITLQVLDMYFFYKKSTIKHLSRKITKTYRSRDALAFVNSQLKSLIDNYPAIACILDEDGSLIFGNDRSEKFISQGLDVSSGKEVISFDLDYLKSQILLDSLKVIESGKSIYYDRRLLSRNNEVYWYRAHFGPIHDDDAKICAVSIFIRNIDQEKRIDEQRESYIATLTHDLKTPTIAQIRALELLLSEQLGSFNGEQHEILKLTLDSCKYMYEMLHTLLTSYRFEKNGVVLTYSSFKLVDVIFECINDLKDIANKNFINIEFNYNNNDCNIQADKVEIKRVLMNLISNAIHCAYPSTQVLITLEVYDKYVYVKVKNSSQYISEELMANLFKKYVTHSEKYNKVGLGLGLYLSKKIIEAHNGKIIAESSPNQYSVFGFQIPLISEPALAKVLCKT